MGSVLVALKISKHSYSSPNEWQKLRSHDVTASVAAALLSAHPYTTRLKLYWEKSGRASAEPERENKIFRDGHLLEGVVADLIRLEKPEWDLQYPYRYYLRDKDHRLGCTPDSQATIPGIGRVALQLKTVGVHAFQREWLDPDTGEIEPPTWIGVQAMIEAMHMGHDSGYIGAMVVKRPLELHLIEVPVIPALYQRLAQASLEFWERVKAGSEPPPEWDRDASIVVDMFSSSEARILDLSEDEDFDQRCEQLVRLRGLRKFLEAAIERTTAQILLKARAADRVLSTRFQVDAPSRVRTSSDGATVRSRPIYIKET